MNLIGRNVGVADKNETVYEEYTIHIQNAGRIYPVGEKDTPSRAVAFAQQILIEIDSTGQTESMVIPTKLSEDFSLWVQMNSRVSHYKDGEYVGMTEYGKVIWKC